MNKLQIWITAFYGSLVLQFISSGKNHLQKNNRAKELKNAVTINSLGPSGECGQAMPYMLVMMLVLIMCWAMMVNIAKLMTDRMMMQNAVDNAAVSAAVYRARTLNTLGRLNYAIGTLLYGGIDTPSSLFWTYHKYGVAIGATGFKAGLPVPLFPQGGLNPKALPGQYAPDDQKRVAGYLDLLSDQAGQSNHLQVDLIKAAVDQFSRTQQLIISGVYPVRVRLLAEEIGKRQEIDNVGNLCGADHSLLIQGASLGLRQNKNGISYYKSSKLDWKESLLIRLPINALLALAGVPAEVKDIYEAKFRNASASSWLYAEKTEFDKSHKITVISNKDSGSASNTGYPLLSGWFNIKWPDIRTIASAGTYNTAGPMFPVEENAKPSDRVSPVLREYLKAKESGWDAHLVPVAQMGIMH